MRRLIAATGSLVLRRPALAVTILLPVAMALGSLAGFAAAGGVADDNSSYRERKARMILTRIRQIDGDYILAAGDSHIERWTAPDICKLPIVNAGLSGATAQSYRRFLADLPLPRPPRAIVLTIGSNDANLKRLGSIAAATLRFQTSLHELVAHLKRESPLVLVTSVPPLGESGADGFSSEAVTRFAATVETTCATRRCRYADPFGGRLHFTDGIHLRDYPAIYGRLDLQLCGMIEPVGTTSAVSDSPTD